ncbi:MAG: four helix bundle protein [Bacteroidota bacterium]
MHNFKELKVWQKSKTLVKEIYVLTRKFPNDERFGLTNQLRRASVSVPSNIAEGCGRGTDKQLIHFLNIAIGSLCEIETQLMLSFDLGFIEEKELKILISEVYQIQKMGYNLKKKLGERE